MRKFKFSKKSISIILTAALLAGFTGCGQSEQASDDAASSGEPAAQASNDASDKNESAGETEPSGEVKKITIGSGIGYEPYAYLDEDGKAIGYEYDVLAAIDEILPDYEFEYESSNFDSILLSLDAGKIDVAAHQYEYTPERAEKYLFSNESYTDYVTRIIVPVENTDINGIDDLQGKTVNGGGVTSATNSILQNYNTEHSDTPINILNFSDNTDEERITALQSGAWDADILPERDADKINAEYGNGEAVLKAVGEPINETSTFYVFNKDDTELQEVFDGALKELKANGTLSEISVKWLGGDYTGSDK